MRVIPLEIFSQDCQYTLINLKTDTDYLGTVCKVSNFTSPCEWQIVTETLFHAWINYYYLVKTDTDRLCKIL